MDRSAWGVRVSVSVELLLAVVGSVTPAGAVTVAVLMSEPVAFGSTVPVSVMLTPWPLARSSPLQIPLPGSKLPDEGVPKTGFNRALGTASVRMTLLTVLGPLLVTVIV